MAIHLTESRLRQIIREEASNYYSSSRINESLGEFDEEGYLGYLEPANPSYVAISFKIAKVPITAAKILEFYPEMNPKDITPAYVMQVKSAYNELSR